MVMAIVLQALDLHWLGGEPDDGADQCAHGKVQFSVGEQVLVTPDDGELTLSAAGLYLLRTLDADLAADDGLTDGSQLFPCCGHSVYAIEGRCVVLGCSNGIDISVRADGETITLQRDDVSATTRRSLWTAAVLTFAGQVHSFYDASVKRAAVDDELEAAGWRLFWEEWNERTIAAAS